MNRADREAPKGFRSKLQEGAAGIEANSTRWVILALVVGVLLRLGLVVATTTPEEPLNRLYPGYTDGTAYLNNAKSLVQDGVYGYGGRASAFRPPAYPAAVALSLALFGNSLTPIRAFQIALFLVMTVCYVAVATGSFGPLAGVLTGWMFAIYPLFVFLSSEMATESLYMALEAVIFFLCIRTLLAPYGRRQSAKTPLVVGVCCGIGALTRPNMVFVFVLVLALAAWRGVREARDAWSTLRVVLLLLAGFGVIVGPWVVRNRVRFGSPVLTTNLEYNFFRGTFDLVHGIEGGRNIRDVFREHGVLYEQEIEDPSRRSLPWSEIDNERAARAASWRIIEDDPWGWLLERSRNAVYLWLNLEWEPTIMSGRTDVQWSAGFVTMIYCIVLSIALCGCFSGGRAAPETSERRCRFMAGLFILAAMPVILTFVGKRYRISMIDPYLLLLAAATLQRWLKRSTPLPAGSSRTPLPPAL